MTVPVVHDLAVQSPDLDITMLSREMARPLFERLPGNVRFVAADLEGRHSGLFGLNRLLKELPLKDYDAVADLHDVLRSQWLRFVARCRGKKVAVIDKGRRGKRALTRRRNKVLAPQATSFERYAQVLAALGFPVTSQFSALDYAAFAEQIKPAGATWVGIAPFAKHPAKVYPREKMEEVIRVLSQQADTTVLLFGGGEEEKRQMAAWCANNPHVQAVQSRHGLAGELALMGQLDVLLSMDSANMHLASLVGTKVVSVWGGTHPYAGFLGWGQRQEDSIQLDLPCRPCSVYGNKPCHRGDYACLNGIASGQILEKLRPYLP